MYVTFCMQNIIFIYYIKIFICLYHSLKYILFSLNKYSKLHFFYHFPHCCHIVLLAFLFLFYLWKSNLMHSKHDSFKCNAMQSIYLRSACRRSTRGQHVSCMCSLTVFMWNHWWTEINVMEWMMTSRWTAALERFNTSIPAD